MICRKESWRGKSCCWNLEKIGRRISKVCCWSLKEVRRGVSKVCSWNLEKIRNFSIRIN